MYKQYLYNRLNQYVEDNGTDLLETYDIHLNPELHVLEQLQLYPIGRLKIVADVIDYMSIGQKFDIIGAIKEYYEFGDIVDVLDRPELLAMDIDDMSGILLGLSNSELAALAKLLAIV